MERHEVVLMVAFNSELGTMGRKQVVWSNTTRNGTPRRTTAANNPCHLLTVAGWTPPLSSILNRSFMEQTGGAGAARPLVAQAKVALPTFPPASKVCSPLSTLNLKP